MVNNDASDNCCLFVATMRAMNFQDDIPSLPNVILCHHSVKVFDLFWMQVAAKGFHYLELVGEPLELEPNSTFPQNTSLNYLFWENECFMLQLTSLVLLENLSKIKIVSLQQRDNRIPRLMYRYRGSLPSDYVPTLDIDTFAICHYIYATQHYAGSIG